MEILSTAMLTRNNVLSNFQLLKNWLPLKIIVVYDDDAVDKSTVNQL